MLIDIDILIENYSLEQMVIGKLNYYYHLIHLLIKLVLKHHLMVILIVLDVLDQHVLDVLNQYHIKKHIILMYVVILYIKMVNGNKENVNIYIILDTRVHRDKEIIMEMRRWMGLSTSVSNAEIGLPSHC